MKCPHDFVRKDDKKDYWQCSFCSVEFVEKPEQPSVEPTGKYGCCWEANKDAESCPIHGEPQPSRKCGCEKYECGKGGPTYLCSCVCHGEKEGKTLHGAAPACKQLTTNAMSCSCEDCLAPQPQGEESVSRKEFSELRYHDVSEEARRWNALLDHFNDPALRKAIFPPTTYAEI